MNSHEVFIHIHQGCFAGTGAIVRLPQCQWSKPDGYGKISQCITTTKHSKAKTACIFLGIYCNGGTEPLTDPMLTYYQMDAAKQTSVNFCIEIWRLSFQKAHFKMPSAKCQAFLSILIWYADCPGDVWDCNCDNELKFVWWLGETTIHINIHFCIIGMLLGNRNRLSPVVIFNSEYTYHTCSSEEWSTLCNRQKVQWYELIEIKTKQVFSDYTTSCYSNIFAGYPGEWGGSVSFIHA